MMVHFLWATLISGGFSDQLWKQHSSFIDINTLNIIVEKIALNLKPLILHLFCQPGGDREPSTEK